jgi:hypothetical protein
MWQYISEVIIAVIAVSGPIIILLIRQHYKLKTIDHALNNVEIDLVDGEEPGNAPSIRQKLNDIAKQLESSILNVQEDRRIDRLELLQQKQVILSKIDDIQSDIKEIKVITVENTKDIIETNDKLKQHIQEEQELLRQIVQGQVKIAGASSEIAVQVNHQEDVL